MGKSILRNLVTDLTHFTKLCSSINIRSGPSQRYFRNVAELVRLMGPVLDQIESEGLLVEQLSRKLEIWKSWTCLLLMLTAKKLMEGSYPLMSKIYNLLQTEVVAAKIQSSIEVICISLSSLSLSAPASSNVARIQERECMSKNHISSTIREAIKSQRENISPSSEALSKIADSLSLLTSQELLLEAVALEKAKVEAMHENKTEEIKLIDESITLVAYMHDCLVKIKQSQTVNGVPIPADFCCPLSLEPMSDPVIVGSEQTYERAFIRKWLDLGLTVCPKTGQNLSHTNLIPNFTVKALIANWCELNNFNFPDPVKSINSNQPLMLLAHAESVATDSHPPRFPSPKALESTRFTSSVDQRSSRGNTMEAYANELPSSQSDLRRVYDDASVSGAVTVEPLDMENGFYEGAL